MAKGAKRLRVVLVVQCAEDELQDLGLVRPFDARKRYALACARVGHPAEAGKIRLVDPASFNQLVHALVKLGFEPADGFVKLQNFIHFPSKLRPTRQDKLVINSLVLILSSKLGCLLDSAVHLGTVVRAFELIAVAVQKREQERFLLHLSRAPSSSGLLTKIIVLGTGCPVVRLLPAAESMIKEGEHRVAE